MQGKKGKGKKGKVVQVYASLINSIRHGLFAVPRIVLRVLPFFEWARIHYAAGCDNNKRPRPRERDDVYVWKDSLRRKDLSGEDNSRIRRGGGGYSSFVSFSSGLVAARLCATLLFFL